MTHEEAIGKGKSYYTKQVKGNSIEEEKGFHLVEETEEYSIFLDNNTADMNDPALLAMSDEDQHTQFMERYKTIEDNSAYCEVIDSSTYRVCAIPKEH